jgi:type IV secretory pathway VirB10-like protein
MKKNNDESSGNLTPESYHATVPTELTDTPVMNVSRTKIVLAVLVGLFLIVGGIFTMFHHQPNRTDAATQETSRRSVAPALPGLNGTDSTNPTQFIADVTPSPFPTQVVHPPPLFSSAVAQPVMPVAQQVQPVQQPAQQMDQQNPSGIMNLEAPPENQNAQAMADIATQEANAGARGNGTQGAADNATENAVNAPARASGEFVTTRSALNAGAANAHLQYVAEHDQGDVGYVRPKSQYQLDPTTVIPARLLTKIVSDLPGPVAAEITTPIYDSATHAVLVIPPGTKLFGQYDTQIAHGQNRLLMSFTRLIFPNGREFAIGGEPAADAQGSAGLSGDVNNHRGSLYTTATLLTVLGGAEAALSPNTTGGLVTQSSIGSQIQSAAGGQLDNVSTKILNQNLEQPPTIIIRPPCLFQIIVTRDLPLDAYQEDAE